MSMAEFQNVPFSDTAKDVVVIAVMGMTGSGKSNFIQKLTGSPDAVVGDGLASCTEKPRYHKFRHDDCEIIMIDTPGFDDTFRTDAAVLQDVADCLKLTYECNLKLTGIIYLHRISDPRMTHGGMRNLAMFRKLCGVDPMKNVILGTTFWGEVNENLARLRETQLKEKPEYWAEMIEEGARMTRFENSRDSALAIVLELITKGRVALNIQMEMCDQGLTLAETKAGEALGEELAKLAKKHAQEMAKLQQEMQEAIKAHDTKLVRALEREKRRNEQDLDALRAQQEVLKADRRNEMRVFGQEWDRRLRLALLEKNEEADAKLKKALAEAQKQDKLNAQKKKTIKLEKTVKYVKIGASLTAATLSIAGCVLNPMNSGHAVSSFVDLANNFFAGDSASGGADEAAA